MSQSRKILLASSALVALAMLPGRVLAAPEGGQVVGGTANISQAGTQTTIQQSTNRAVINWQKFNVAPTESVTFTVPNNGATLNRVVGSDASLIQGSVSSNGSLYLVNPNGIVFDVGSNVSAQNFVASTANVSTDNFMAGQGNFTLASSVKDARIDLKGTITVADRGVVGIFAPQIDNQGTITANLGTIVLGGTSTATIDFTGNGLMNFELGAADAALMTKASVSNSGMISSSGGRIEMTARGAQDLVNSLVENSGTISANSLTAKGGVVNLVAYNGDVNISGRIDVSGATGGGDVSIGGFGTYNPQTGRYDNGTNQVVIDEADIPNADILADAKQTGNGGSVSVKAKENINFQRFISARGGSVSGNGGNVSISSIQKLDFQGIVSTRAAHGTRGNLSIFTSSNVLIGSTSDAAVATFNANNGLTNASWSVISRTTLAFALNDNDVTIDTTSSSYGNVTPSTAGSVNNGFILVATGLALKSAYSLSLTGNGIDIENIISSVGSITLSSSGSFAKSGNQYGILINADMTAGRDNRAISNISISQTGSVTAANGINGVTGVDPNDPNRGGNGTNGGFAYGISILASLTASGKIELTESGTVTAGKGGNGADGKPGTAVYSTGGDGGWGGIGGFAFGIYTSNSGSLSAGGQINISQTGEVLAGTGGLGGNGGLGSRRNAPGEYGGWGGSGGWSSRGGFAHGIIIGGAINSKGDVSIIQSNNVIAGNGGLGGYGASGSAGSSGTDGRYGGNGGNGGNGGWGGNGGYAVGISISTGAAINHADGKFQITKSRGAVVGGNGGLGNVGGSGGNGGNGGNSSASASSGGSGGAGGSGGRGGYGGQGGSVSGIYINAQINSGKDFIAEIPFPADPNNRPIIMGGRGNDGGNAGAGGNAGSGGFGSLGSGASAGGGAGGNGGSGGSSGYSIGISLADAKITSTSGNILLNSIGADLRGYGKSKGGNGGVTGSGSYHGPKGIAGYEGHDSQLYGIRFYSYTTTVTLTAGGAANNASISLYTLQQKIYLGRGNTILSGGTVNITQIAGGIIDRDDAAGIIDASGLDVKYSGQTTGHNAKIAIGAGSFSYIADNSATTTSTILNDNSFASGLGFGFTGPGTSTTINGQTMTSFTSGGLTITTTGGLDNVNKISAIYGGDVILDGITSNSAVGKMTYIQGKSVTFSNHASNFANPVTIRSNSGDITLNSDVVGTGFISLVSAGAITGNGLVAAPILYVAAQGNVSMNGSIDYLMDYSNSLENSSFSLTNNKSLGIFTNIDVGTNSLTLATTNGNISLWGGIAGQLVILNSAGKIGGTGLVTAPILNISANGDVSLNSSVNILMNYTNLSANSSFSLSNNKSLSVLTSINTGTNSLNLTTSNGDLTLYADISGGTVTLNSAGWIGNTGVVTATILTGRANDNVFLTTNVTNLGAFSNNGGEIYLSNRKALNVNGAVTAGVNNVTLNTITGNVTLDTARGGSVTGGAVIFNGIEQTLPRP